MNKTIRQLYSAILTFNVPANKLRDRAFNTASVKKLLIELDKYQ